MLFSNTCFLRIIADDHFDHREGLHFDFDEVEAFIVNVYEFCIDGSVILIVDALNRIAFLCKVQHFLKRIQRRVENYKDFFSLGNGFALFCCENLID